MASEEANPVGRDGSVTYARRIGLFSGTMLVVGGIIGSGIFLNPAIVAQRVGTSGLTMLAWGIGAVIALLGALVFAELGARHPAAGGGYAYLRDAFGPLPAFLYGWALLLAIATGAMAAVAVTFASHAGSLLGLPASADAPLAITAIALLTLINVLGVRPGTAVQNFFTVLKLLAIGVLVLYGLTGSVAGGGAATAAPLTFGPGSTAAAQLHGPVGATALALAMGTALVPVLFAYGGWQQTNFVAEEMRDPERTLPRALVIGVVLVALVYLGVNLTYLKALGVDGLAASRAPAADVMAIRLGEFGRRLMTAGIAISTFGFLNLVILVTPRVYQAMARDGLFFRQFATLHPRFRTPVTALLAQGAWAVALLLSGSYGALLDWVTFADWIFFGLTAATLIVYRRRDRRAGTAGAEAEVPGFRAPAWVLTVGLFLLAAVYVVAGAIVSNPANAVRGTLVLLAGIPVYAIWRRSPRP